MAWETYKHERNVSSEPAVTISAQGRISFNKAGVALLSDVAVKRAELLWDKAKSRIGIRPTSSVTGTLPLQIATSRNTANVSGIQFLNYIQYDWSKTRSFAAEWDQNDKIFVVKIPKEYFGSAPLSRSGNKLSKSRTKEVPKGTS